MLSRFSFCRSAQMWLSSLLYRVIASNSGFVFPIGRRIRYWPPTSMLIISGPGRLNSAASDGELAVQLTCGLEERLEGVDRFLAMHVAQSEA
jgi:hypothetical protein